MTQLLVGAFSWRQFQYCIVAAAALVTCLASGDARAQSAGCSNARPTVFEWQPIRVPKPSNLCDFVKNEDAAIRLGKALFWDMQLGSDGVTACASCHFHAGADSRVRNQLSPTGSPASDQPGASFEVHGPNGRLVADDFLFHELADREDRNSEVLFDSDDVVSSQGVTRARFVDIRPGRAADRMVVVPDPVFNVGGINTRRVEPRNAPTVINAVFNVEQFWDGRGKFWFNGVNQHGLLDEGARVLVRQGAGLGAPVAPVKVEIDMASLASQALAPPVNEFEMSAAGRTWPKIGKKLLSLRPLGKQVVHPEDSVLGPKSRDDGSLTRRGLKVSYRGMIRKAFNGRYWKSDRLFDQQQNEIGRGEPSDTDEFTLMEMNFPLFFGLAVQLYESTLISDDSPLDHFMAGDSAAMTEEEQLGMDLFVNQLPCINCHKLPEVNKATIEHMIEFPTGIDSIIERMRAATGGANGCQVCNPLYDGGFYNVGARPLLEDLGRAETVVIGEDPDAIELPKGFTPFAKIFGQAALRIPIPQLRQPVQSGDAMFIAGAMRVPSLRNAELTGPYYHHGGLSTLFDVVQFYTRGSDFRNENLDVLDAGIGLPESVALLKGHPERQRALAAFMARPLTDERVRFERAPFDHPQIFVPHGHLGNGRSVTDDGTGRAVDRIIEIAAVGANGTDRPLGTFLDLSPTAPSP
jgi:cytochrome c peroxidase